MTYYLLVIKVSSSAYKSKPKRHLFNAAPDFKKACTDNSWQNGMLTYNLVRRINIPRSCV